MSSYSVALGALGSLLRVWRHLEWVKAISCGHLEHSALAQSATF